MTSERSALAEVRNPILSLPAAAKLAALPPEALEALCDILADVRADSRDRAEECWRKHKGPMAAYWKAVSVYAGHISKAARRLARQKAEAPKAPEEMEQTAIAA